MIRFGRIGTYVIGNANNVTLQKDRGNQVTPNGWLQLQMDVAQLSFAIIDSL